MAKPTWPPPSITPIFTPQAAQPEPKTVEPTPDFAKAATDSKAAKLSNAEPSPSPGGPSLNQGAARVSVAEKSVGGKLPDTRSGKAAPRVTEFNRVGRHRANGPDNGPQLGP